MSFFQICLVVIIGVFLIIFLKQVKAEFAHYLSIFICIGLFIISIQKLGNIFSMVNELIADCEDFVPFFKILIKMIGISFISEVTIGICKDAGLLAMAEGMEILTRILLCMISLPVLKEVFLLLDSYL